MIILAIETSCDETAASIVAATEDSFDVRAHVVSSQIALHAQWGGVVPHLAAREHVKNAMPVLTQALADAQITHKEIDLIAVTNGPGLIPALLVGVDVAKTLSYLWHKPLLGIHHIEGHIYANFLTIQNSKFKIQNSVFSLLALVVSGGHTQLVLMKNHCDYTIIGQTQDDAAGEAFDKVARILGLSYPGGPAIAAMATENPKSEIRNPKISLPRPMIDSDDLRFSFSGLKTAVLYATKKYRVAHQLSDNDALPKDFVCAMSCEFQQAVVDVLVAKTLAAAHAYAPHTILLAGGVAANVHLRAQLGAAIARKFPHTQFLTPALRYSLDNATMIAAAAYYRWQQMSPTQKENALHSWQHLRADANLPLPTSLS